MFNLNHIKNKCSDLLLLKLAQTKTRPYYPCNDLVHISHIAESLLLYLEKIYSAPKPKRLEKQMTDEGIYLFLSLHELNKSSVLNEKASEYFQKKARKWEADADTHLSKLYKNESHLRSLQINHTILLKIAIILMKKKSCILSTPIGILDFKKKQAKATSICQQLNLGLDALLNLHINERSRQDDGTQSALISLLVDTKCILETNFNLNAALNGSHNNGAIINSILFFLLETDLLLQKHRPNNKELNLLQKVVPLINTKNNDYNLEALGIILGATLEQRKYTPEVFEIFFNPTVQYIKQFHTRGFKNKSLNGHVLLAWPPKRTTLNLTFSPLAKYFFLKSLIYKTKSEKASKNENLNNI